MFSEDEEIIYSGFILKEIKFKLNDENLFKEKLEFLEKEESFRFVKATEEDYEFARKLESELKYELSFYDCLHVTMCKRLDFVLVTRDNDLIKFASKFISVERPENLLF